MSWALTGFFLVLFGAAGRARADAPLPAQAPAGAGQLALSVFASKGDVMAAACAAAPCSAAAVSLGVPAELLRKPARAEVVAIGQGRHAVVVSSTDGIRSFRAVVVAPLTPGPPKLLFAGLVGLLNGQDGSRTGPMLQVFPADGLILVGEENESVSLCGRPTIIAPMLVNPKTLELQNAKVQRLGLAERDQAREIKAVRLADDEVSHAASGVLTPLGASSGLGGPQAIADGDSETSWSENRGGDGKGEFVVMRAPPELSIAGLELTIRPRQAAVAGGASPQHLFIAGPRDVVSVTLPEDAWKYPGARYRVPLSPALQGACLAVVLDTAFNAGPASNVTIADVKVESEFDASQLPALVRALAGGGQRAEAAKTLLVAAGAPAFAEVAKEFDGLDEGGRRVALDVMDAAPCELSAPVYVAALSGKIEAHARHAQSRLRRCGAPGGEALAQALTKSDKTDKRLMPLLVMELSITDPARSVQAFLPLMDEKTVMRRRLLRTALAQAARTPQAAQAVRKALADPQTSEVALVDLLRALGDEAPRYQPEAAAALQRLQASASSFRARYLLIGPTAVLSRVAPAAEATFRKQLGQDPDAHVRVAALGLVLEPQRFQAELLKALADSEMRVREASVRALGSERAGFASQALSERLAKDQWPLVRAAAADALAYHARGAALDAPLAAALIDDSALVRARSIRALGERRAAGVSGKIRDRLVDEEEWPEVRAEAARSLGTLCDSGSADILAAFAKKLADPMASPEAQLIATGAVLSLGRLALPNLRDALAPLTAKNAPPQARRAAAVALSARDTCRAPAAGKSAKQH